MEINSKSIKEYILSKDIDLVGIASADNLILAKPPRPATSIMPTAKSVIVMGVAHSLGAVYADDIKIWTRNKMQNSRILDEVAEKVSRILEREGFLTTPISADKPVEIHKVDPITGKKLKQIKTISQFSLKHAAVSAGMGQLAKSNLLLTEEFGPHQRLCAIITEAPLEPDPRKRWNLCIEGCKRCENACPVGALKGGRYNVDPCFGYWGYGMKFPKSRRGLKMLKLLIHNNKYRAAFTEMSQVYITDVDYCINCMKVCPIGTKWEKIRPNKMKIFK